MRPSKFRVLAGSLVPGNMSRACSFSVLLGWPILLVNRGVADEGAVIVTPAQSTLMLTLAARETMRYVYLRTGHLLPIQANDAPTGNADVIVISVKGSPVLGSLALDSKTQAEVATLDSQQYLLKTVAGTQGHKTLVIVGGDQVGALYGTYRFIERLGVRFYLHGDTIPDAQIPLALPALDETGKPLFALRGIQPFHDFPEGPDWWNRDDYLAYVEQLPKMRMNFLGLHTYPEGSSTAEPAVWIGSPSDIVANGKVRFSYPASWYNTQPANRSHGTNPGFAKAPQPNSWDYVPGLTSGFSCGASELFSSNVYGPEVMDGLMPTPTTPEQCNLLFNRVGQMYSEVFAEARLLGVKTCIGTETPLTIPKALQDHLKEQGKDPQSLDVRKELYKGIFRRISTSYPVDFYWLWTPEPWTWQGNTPQQFARTTDDLQAAIDAMKELQHPFQLATCGWVLGPVNDRAALDTFLPKDMPMSCINRQVGNDPIDPAFGKVTDRPTWAIPWLENDPQLTAPQPWVGRMLYDAADAKYLGCSGLLGIHWRTKIIAPNIAALAGAGWDQSYVPMGVNFAAAKTDRSMGAAAFYSDFATANFGPAVGESAGKIMTEIDGVHLLSPAKWINGPGEFFSNTKPWEQIRASYDFVDRFAALRSQVAGAGNLDRFDYWLNTYRYLAAAAQAECVRGQLDLTMKKIDAEKDSAKKKDLATQALDLRISLARLWDQLMDFQEATVSTPGELGTITNLELHTRKHHFLDADDKKLSAALGAPLPDTVNPANVYHGPSRIIVPTVRGEIKSGERLHLTVILLGIKSPGQLFWRPLGQGNFTSLPLTLKGRSVYEATLPAMPPTATAFEYYIEAGAGDSIVRFPVSAPALNQSVIISN